MGRPICYDHADLSMQKCTKIPQQFMSPPSVHKNSYENNYSSVVSTAVPPYVHKQI